MESELGKDAPNAVEAVFDGPSLEAVGGPHLYGYRRDIVVRGHAAKRPGWSWAVEDYVRSERFR